MRLSRTALTIAALPGAAMLVAFYSLAIHMNRSIHGWPSEIGEKGFSPALLAHSWIAGNLYGLLLFSALALPIPILFCLFVKRFQRLLPYLTMYAGTICLSFILTQFAAPERFLCWWRH